MDYKNISNIVKSLSNILVNKDLTSIKVKNSKIELKIKKDRQVAQYLNDISSSDAENINAIDEKKEKNIAVLKSHKIGFFHLFNSKKEKNYVAANDKVKKNQKLGYIESLNQHFAVKSNVKCSIHNILVTEGQAVEYDQPLFELEVEE